MKQRAQRHLQPVARCRSERQDRTRRSDGPEAEGLGDGEHDPEASELAEKRPERCEGAIEALGFGRIPLLCRTGNRGAVVRLVGALMLEQNDEWAVSRRYMPVEKLTVVCNDTDVATIIAAQ